MTRTPPKKKAKELAKLLRTERPDYPYLKSVCDFTLILAIALTHIVAVA